MRTVSETISLKDTPKGEVSKYITKISNIGITVHPEVLATNSNYLQLDGNGLRIKNFTNTNNDSTLASFLADGITLGNNDGSQSYLYLDYHSLQMFDKEAANIIGQASVVDLQAAYEIGDIIKQTDYATGFRYYRCIVAVPATTERRPWDDAYLSNWEEIFPNSYLYISDLRNKTGIAYLTESFILEEGEDTVYVSYPIYNARVVDVSINGNHDTVYNAPYSGFWIQILQPAPQAGDAVKITYATIGDSSHDAQKLKAYSLGMRKTNSTIGPMSFVEGHNNIASGFYSHAEGSNTIASGKGAHAEGLLTEAKADCSHAQNICTIAAKDAQTALGKYNIEDVTPGLRGKYVVIIGNGEDEDNRSNALTVDWDGVVSCKDVVASNLIGEIKQYAGATVPTGWLECDGSEVAVADYPLLYAAIGDLWGTPSDSDHFILPDFRGRVPIGDGLGTDDDAISRTVGTIGGSERITLNDAQMAHGHGFTNPTIPAHAHNLTGNLDDSAALSGSNPSPRGAVMRRGSGNTWQITNSDGGGGRTSGGAVANLHGDSTTRESHGNMQPYAVVKYIICAV